MKLILQHGPQQVEYEFLSGQGTPLTNQQALRGIELAYRHWKSAIPEYDEDASLAQKAAALLVLMADHMQNAARRQWQIEREATNRESMLAEIG